MTRVVIVARTHMHHDHVCIGGHDLDRHFRGVRLLDKFGGHWPTDSPFHVGEVWTVRYTEKGSARPPHVEDVFVLACQRVAPVRDLRALVLEHVVPWQGGPEVLFHGTVQRTSSGTNYIPVRGPLPRCSTGYWVPDRDLPAMPHQPRRFLWEDNRHPRRFTWVGVQEPPCILEAGSLMRVSLSRAFKAETAPEGYYVQLSGVLV